MKNSFKCQAQYIGFGPVFVATLLRLRASLYP
jgi:hypothetical protein